MHYAITESEDLPEIRWMLGWLEHFNEMSGQ